MRIRHRLRRLLPLLALAFTATASSARGGEPTPADLVRAYRTADPSALALVARAMPESALAALLDRGSPSECRAAAHAARFARDPLTLAAPLARAMASGDAEVSPAAARALLALADRRGPMPTLEHTNGELRAALAPALALADTPGTRPDVAAAARALQAWLEQP